MLLPLGLIEDETSVLFLLLVSHKRMTFGMALDHKHDYRFCVKHIFIPFSFR